MRRGSQHRVLRTTDFGCPQNRERVYWVGIRTDVQKEAFQFPPPQPLTTLESILDPLPKGRKVTAKNRPKVTQHTAQKNLDMVLADLRAKGHNPFKECFAADIYAGKKLVKVGNNFLYCLLRSRPYGHWINCPPP